MPRSFSQFYETHKDLVFNVALQYTHNQADAEEITQDVFVAAHRKMSAFRGESGIKTWIYRITINKSLDFLKAQQRQKRQGFTNAIRLGDIPQVPIAHFDHPGVCMENKESLERLFAQIHQLPENQKTALILLKIEQLSQREVAEIMKSTPKAVESLFQRAKKNLSQMRNATEGSD